MISEEDIQNFGEYELGQYASAFFNCKALERDRDREIKTLYEDIHPTMTCTDYEEGRCYTISTNPETMALSIVSTRERYDKLIERLKLKAQWFELAMNTLTDRELDVIRVFYLYHPNNLGLSDSYFHQVLSDAEKKLCGFLSDMRLKQIEQRKEKEKAELKEKVQRFLSD